MRFFGRFLPFMGLIFALCLAVPAHADAGADRHLTRARILAHRDLLCSRARAYDVRPDHLARLLEMNLNAYGIADHLQDQGAITGWFFRWYGYRPGSTLPEAVYAEHHRADAERARRAELNPRRNQRTHWIFTSFGPAQIQLYVARGLTPSVRAHGGNAPTEWQALARTLVSFEGAVEFLAAALREMIDIYRERAGLDLRDRYAMLWELHMTGSIPQRAEIRREAERRGTPLPMAIEVESEERAWKAEFAACGH